MKKFILLLLACMTLSSCGAYKLVYLYNDKGEITDEFLAKKEKSKELKTYQVIDENGTKVLVTTIDLTNKEKNRLKKRIK